MTASTRAKRPTQGRFGFGGYPYHRAWIHRAMWIAPSRLIAVSSCLIGNERAGALDVWRVEGDIRLADALFRPARIWFRD